MGRWQSLTAVEIYHLLRYPLRRALYLGSPPGTLSIAPLPRHCEAWLVSGDGLGGESTALLLLVVAGGGRGPHLQPPIPQQAGSSCSLAWISTGVVCVQGSPSLPPGQGGAGAPRGPGCLCSDSG